MYLYDDRTILKFYMTALKSEMFRKLICSHVDLLCVINFTHKLHTYLLVFIGTVVEVCVFSMVRSGEHINFRYSVSIRQVPSEFIIMLIWISTHMNI